MPADPPLIVPRSLVEALEVLAAQGPRARVVAGGTVAVADFNRRRRIPEVLIPIGRLEELRQIRQEDGCLAIGAGVSFAMLRDSALVQQQAPLLAEAASLFHGPAIQAMATLGGNLATAHNAADGSVVLLALDAEVVLRGLDGERRVAVAGLFLDLWRTVCRPEELIVEIRVPCPTGGTGAHFIKRGPLSTGLPVVSAAACLGLEAGRLREARIGLGALAPTPVRARQAEALLAGNVPDDEALAAAGQAALVGTSPVSDRRGSAWYRRQVAPVIVRRALEGARQRALAAVS